MNVERGVGGYYNFSGMCLGGCVDEESCFEADHYGFILLGCGVSLA